MDVLSGLSLARHVLVVVLDDASDADGLAGALSLVVCRRRR